MLRFSFPAAEFMVLNPGITGLFHVSSTSY